MIKQEEEIFTETLKIPLPVAPKNIVTSYTSKQNTYSPANKKSPKKIQKFHLSPGWSGGFTNDFMYYYWMNKQKLSHDFK